MFQRKYQASNTRSDYKTYKVNSRNIDSNLKFKGKEISNQTKEPLVVSIDLNSFDSNKENINLNQDINENCRNKFTTMKNHTLLSRHKLIPLRILVKKLVYVQNLPMSFDDPKILLSKNYFSKFGTPVKYYKSKVIVFNKPTITAYLTYESVLEAANTIVGFDKAKIDDRQIKLGFGATKYCNNFINRIKCTFTNCSYIHSYAKEEDIIYESDRNDKNIIEKLKKLASSLSTVKIKEVHQLVKEENSNIKSHEKSRNDITINTASSNFTYSQKERIDEILEITEDYDTSRNINNKFKSNLNTTYQPLKGLFKEDKRKSFKSLKDIFDYKDNVKTQTSRNPNNRCSFNNCNNNFSFFKSKDSEINDSYKNIHKTYNNDFLNEDFSLKSQDNYMNSLVKNNYINCSNFNDVKRLNCYTPSSENDDLMKTIVSEDTHKSFKLSFVSENIIRQMSKNILDSNFNKKNSFISINDELLINSNEEELLLMKASPKDNKLIIKDKCRFNNLIKKQIEQKGLFKPKPTSRFNFNRNTEQDNNNNKKYMREINLGYDLNKVFANYLVDHMINKNN